MPSPRWIHLKKTTTPNWLLICFVLALKTHYFNTPNIAFPLLLLSPYSLQLDILSFTPRMLNTAEIKIKTNKQNHTYHEEWCHKKYLNHLPWWGFQCHLSMVLSYLPLPVSSSMTILNLHPWQILYNIWTIWTIPRIWTVTCILFLSLRTWFFKLNPIFCGSLPSPCILS